MAASFGYTFFCSVTGCPEYYATASPHRDLARAEAESAGWTIEPDLSACFCPLHRGRGFVREPIPVSPPNGSRSLVHDDHEMMV